MVGGFDEDQIWDVVDEFPEDSAAIVLLLEHRPVSFAPSLFQGSLMPC